LIPYSALGFGRLTGKYLNCGKPKGACLTLFPPSGVWYHKPNVGAASAAYVDLANRNGLSPAKMAIAFVPTVGSKPA
jgi:aryl-alcohol dehydrogenase-like predicted oxidoreductase